MAATQGHTQSLHTNALDEALALPTDFSARIARNTQLLLQQESGTTRPIDPWGGSYYVERLTHELAERAWAHIQEVEPAGGMAQAIERGHPEAAHRGGRGPHPGPHRLRRADGDRRQQVPGRTRTTPIEVLKVDNAGVRASRSPSSSGCAPSGTTAAVDRRAGRADPRRAERRRTGNLLALAVDAARAKATVGEISDALEKVYGRHQAEIRTISGVYRDEAERRATSAARHRASREVRRGRGPPAPHPGRQDGPGRARPRAEGRSPPRSPTSASTSTWARCSRPRRRWPSRPSTPTCTWSGCRSLAAGHLTLVPALRDALAEVGPARHHDRGRRRHPARRLRRAVRRWAPPRCSCPAR